MSLFTQINLPIIDSPITGSGTVTCNVTSGSVLITIRRNGVATLDNQQYSPAQGYSSFFNTNVDNAAWQISVTGDALSVFTLTTPN